MMTNQLHQSKPKFSELLDSGVSGLAAETPPDLRLWYSDGRAKAGQ
jgi:hypothetical protein